ncbi:unnamed protein product, partial [Prorocentrum cordatum]
AEGKVTSADKDLIRRAVGCEVQHRARRNEVKTLKITGPLGMEAAAVSMTWGILQKNGISADSLTDMSRRAAEQATQAATARYLDSNVRDIPAHDDWSMECDPPRLQGDSLPADASSTPSSCRPSPPAGARSFATTISPEQPAFVVSGRVLEMTAGDVEDQGFNDIPALEAVVREVVHARRAYFI